MSGFLALSENAPFLIDTATQGALTRQATATLADGRVVVAWQETTGSFGDNSGSAVHARLLNADGSLAVAEFLVNSTTLGDQREPVVAALAGGGFMIAWVDASQAATSRGLDIRAQGYAANGTRSGAEFLVNSITDGDQTDVDLAGLTGGNAAIGWNSAGAASTSRLAVFAPAGQPVVGEQAGPAPTNGSYVGSGFEALIAGTGDQFVTVTTSSFFGGGVSTTFTGTTWSGDGGNVSSQALLGSSSRYARVGLQDYVVLQGGATATAYQVRIIDAGGHQTANELRFTSSTNGSTTALATVSLAADTTIASLAITHDGTDHLLAAYTDAAGLHVGVVGGGSFVPVLYQTGAAPAAAAETVITSLAEGRFLVTWADAAGSIDGQFFDLLAGAALQDGTAGDDALIGTAARDYLRGFAGNDVLIGRGGADYLEGGAGDDVLVAGIGPATLKGGDGNDSYFVADAATLVVEDAAAPGSPRGLYGYDSVHASVSFTLPADVEALYLTGTAITGIGNDLPNVLVGNNEANVLRGLGDDDLLQGAGGNDELSGGDGRDQLYGGAGDDLVYGGEGADALFGEVGNDRLYAETGDDTAYGGAGNDTLFGQQGRDSLFGEASDDTAYGGTEDDFLAGQDGDDVLWGEDGNDFLYGGAGQDQLAGGAGADIFYFRGRDENADMLVDFSHAEGDRLVFEGANFAMPSGFGLTAGVGLLQGAGVTPVAQTATFYFDTNSRALWFDPDGTGAGAPGVVAFLLNSPALAVDDFIIA